MISSWSRSHLMKDKVKNISYYEYINLLMQKKYIKLILPVVAILVILQSVMIVENLAKNKRNDVVVNEPVITQENQPTKIVVPSVVVQKPAELVVEVKGPIQMQVGKSYPVEVYLNGVAAVKPLTLETYIGFNPAMAKITTLKTGTNLPKADFSKVDSTKGIVVSNFLLSQELSFVPGQKVMIESFFVTPTVAGELSLNVLDNQSEKTLFVENGTARTIPFSTIPLVVNVGR